MDSIAPRTTPEPVAETLRRLEVTIIWLWSGEPVCDIGERHGLLERLGAVSMSVERLAFRYEFEPDHTIDVDDLDECVGELDDLARFWLDLDVGQGSSTR